MLPIVRDKILEVMKENSISLSSLRDMARYEIEKFLAKLFLKSGDPGNSYHDEKGKPIYEYYLNYNHSWQLFELEQVIQADDKYVLVHERKHDPGKHGTYFANSWSNLKDYKKWLDSFDDGAFVPVFLIENGKTRFDVTFEVKHKVKPSLEM